MTHKGFGANTQSLLIKGWLIPENRQYYRFKTGAIVLESLPMMVNMWIAMASERFKQDDADTIKSAEATLVLISDIDTERLQDLEEDIRWRVKLKHDDKFYIEYYNHLLNLIKQSIISGNYADLNGAVQNTWEYKQWMTEAGYLLVAPQLIDGWLHPLSETHTFNGEEAFDLWAVASIACAAATGRNPDISEKEICITRLIQLEVLKSEDYQTRLDVCKFLDAEYFKLLSEVKNALDKKFDIAFKDK